MQYIRGLGSADPKGFYDLVVQHSSNLGIGGVSFDWSRTDMTVPAGGLFSKKSPIEDDQANALVMLFHETIAYTILAYPFGDYIIFQTWSGQRGSDDKVPFGDLWDLQVELFLELAADAAAKALDDFLSQHEVSDAPSAKDVFGV